MSNFASTAMGAEIVEVSNDPSFGPTSSSAAPSATSSDPRNLLLDRNDALWLAGDAPQHVTIRIKDGHPPIRFVGWHVWQDYVTNPKTVVVTSGEALPPKQQHNQRGGLLDSFVMECAAVAGAGTQLWELPAPIPTEHCYVQFKVTSTFAPGPTYMNRLVLFSTHPGGDFAASQTQHQQQHHNEGQSSAVHPPPHISHNNTANTDLDMSTANTITSAIGTANANNFSAASLVGGGQGGQQGLHTPLHVDTTARGGPPPLNHHYGNRHGGGGAPSSPFSATNNHFRSAHNNTTINASGINNSANYRIASGHRGGDRGGGGYDSDRGYDSSSRGGGDRYGTNNNRERGGSERRAGSVQMSELLAGLDDDIKRLHPIKTISPTKRGGIGANGRSISPSVMLPEVEDLNAMQTQMADHNAHLGMLASMGGYSQQSTAPSLSTYGAPSASPAPPPMPMPVVVAAPSPASVSPPHVQYVQIPAPPPDPAGQEALARVTALERAVEMLTRAVERQSTDISEMRRLLAEQAAARSAEAREQRELFALEARRAAKEEAINASHAAAAAAVAAKAVTTTTTASSSSAVATNNNSNGANGLQLIEFPETALKSYIEDVLAPRLAKHARRAEARTVQQIDDHMHVLLKEIGAVVDERVERHLHKIMRDGARHPYSRAVHGAMGMGGADAAPARGGGGGVGGEDGINVTHHHRSHATNNTTSATAASTSGRGGGASFYGTYEEIYGHGGSRQRSGVSRSGSFSGRY